MALCSSSSKLIVDYLNNFGLILFDFFGFSFLVKPIIVYLFFLGYASVNFLIDFFSLGLLILCNLDYLKYAFYYFFLFSSFSFSFLLLLSAYFL